MTTYFNTLTRRILNRDAGSRRSHAKLSKFMFNMNGYIIFFMCATVLLFKCVPADGFFFITPEDVAQAFTTVYGFAPRIYKGNDHRLGFGFRFGEHADLQLLYEFGPQTSTRSLEQTRIRSAPYRQRQVRRPFLEFLLRAGVLHKPSYEFNLIHDADEDDDEPR